MEKVTYLMEEESYDEMSDEYKKYIDTFNQEKDVEYDQEVDDTSNEDFTLINSTFKFNPD